MPLTGKHARHAQTAGISCSVCHGASYSGTTVPTGSGTTHVDKNINLAWTGLAVTPITAYSKTNTFAAGSAVYGTCSNSYCHSTVQNPTTGADSVLLCGAAHFGRGCLYLTGSIIHRTRATVNGSATNRGYAKRYSFDRCAVSSPPPFFPATGRFLENRYFEVDRGRFSDVSAAFRALSPRP